MAARLPEPPEHGSSSRERPGQASAEGQRTDRLQKTRSLREGVSPRLLLHPATGRFWPHWDVTVIGTEGSQRWQRFGRSEPPKSLEIARNRCYRLRLVAVWIGW